MADRDQDAAPPGTGDRPVPRSPGTAGDPPGPAVLSPSLSVPRVPSLRSSLLVSVGTALVALLYRLHLASVYFGQEEEDWGTLGLIFGAYQSGLRYVETEHMPLYVDLAAAVTYLTGGRTELAGEIVAIGMGTLTVFLVTLYGMRWLGPATGVVAGLVVAFQPESALYSATTLRVSTYTALTLVGVGLVGVRRFIPAGIAFSLAFLTRFEAGFIFLPALLLAAQWSLQRPPEGETRWSRGAWGALAAAAILFGVMLLWAAYYHAQEGTWAFWGGVADRNTGAFVERGLLAKLAEGFATLRALIPKLLPAHLSLPVLALAPLGALLVLGRVAAQVGPARWLLFAGVLGWGFFFLVVLLSAYHWNHNLYWKWLCADVPYSAWFGAHGAVFLVGLLRRSPRMPVRAGGVALAVALILGTAATFEEQTRYQLERSERWNGTQIRLMDWFEAHYPEDATVLADLVPQTYLLRRPSSRRVYSWQEEALPRGDAEAFGAWLLEREVFLVVWFREEWVGSVEAAPFLGGGTPVDAGPARLVPIAREDGYGFVAYRVEGPGLEHAKEGPPPEAGGLDAAPPPE